MMNEEINQVDISAMIPIIEESLKLNKPVKFKVRGKSMFPTLVELRDSVILEKKGKYKKYDIILYKRDNGGYVLHRIVGEKNGAFKLCGDNQTEIEYPIRPQQVIAVATRLERNGKIIDVKNKKYTFAVWIWTNFIALRPEIFKITMKLRRFKNKIKK